MIGDRLMIGLLVFYLILSAVFAWEGQWPKCTYWLGAAVITGSVLAMKA